MALPDTITTPGAEICLDAVACETIDVLGMQYSINWDPEVLEFEEVTNFNLSSLASGNFGTAFVADGTITFSWFDFSASAVTIIGGTSIYQLCFTVIGNSGDGTNVAFTNNPVPIEIIQSIAGIDIGLVQKGGNVTVGGPTIVQLAAEEEFAEEDESVCLDVSVNFFDDMDTLRGVIEWDTAVVQFDSIVGLNLTDLDIGDFDLSNTVAGEISFEWNSNSGGITLADGSVIFTLCFTAVGTLGDFTDVSFDPDQTSASSTSVPLVEVVNFDGSVRISTPLTLYMGYLETEINSSFCIDVDVIDFTDIQSFQYTIVWDTSIIQLDTINNLNLQWLELNQFNIEPGVLTVSWFDFDFSGETLADSSTLFRLCFDAVGGVGDCSPIAVVDEPTPREVIDIGDNSIGLASIDGLVKLTSVIKIIDTLINPVNCNFPDTGAIDISVFGGVEPYTYQWNTGETTQDISGKFNGNFSVLIKDAEDNTLLANFTIPGNFDVPDVNAGPDTLIDCLNLPLYLTGDGSADGPYEYRWETNNGDIDSTNNQFEVFVSLPGVYVFIIEDTTNGCAASDSLIVTGTLNFPNADAGSQKEISCANTVALLDGSNSSSGANFIYLWEASMGGNIQSGETTLTPLIDVAGQFTLTVTDTTNGCSDVDQVMVVNNFLTAEGDAGGDTTLTCSDTIINLNASASAGFAFNQQWYTTDGNILSGSTTLQPEINQPGTYCMVVFNIENGCADTSCLEVTYDTVPPIANAGPLAELDCNTMAKTLNGAGSSIGIQYNYKWAHISGGTGNGISSSDTILTPLVKEEGVYRLRVENSINGCVAEDTVTVIADLDIPAGGAGNDTSLTCVLDQLQLSASSAPPGDTYVYNWSTNDGTIVTGQNTPNPLINDDGNYFLMITDVQSGCVKMDTVAVFYDTIPPVAEAGATEEITCINLAPVLNGSNSSQGSGFDYQWTTDDGNIVAGDTTIFPSVNAIGTYTLEVTDVSTGCTSTDEVEVISIVDFPTSQAGNDSSFTCVADTLTLSGAGSDSGNNIVYFWSSNPPGGIVSGEETLNPVIVAPGVYTLAVVNTTTECFTEDSIVIVVDTIPPQIDTVSFGILNCVNDAVTIDLELSSTGSYDFEWTSVDGSPITDPQTAAPSVNTAGVYEVLVTDTQNGCTATEAVQIQEDTEEPEAFAGALADSVLTCMEPSLSVDASSTVIEPQYNFVWETSNGNITTDPNEISIDVDQPGEYNFIVIDTINGCSDTAVVAITDDFDFPEIDFAEPDTIDCIEIEVDVDASGSSTGPEFTYAWAVVDLGNITGPTDQLLTSVNAAGQYQLTISNGNNGCVITDTVEVQSDTITPQADAGIDFDLLCESDPVNLDGGNSSSGPDILYQWTTVNGTILQGEASTSPLIDGPGTYELLVTNEENGCTSTASIDVIQSETLEEALAGEDDILCDNSGSAVVLNASGVPSSTGFWTSPTGATFNDATSPSAEVTSGLQTGENIFIWTLSTTNCPSYDQDTVSYFVETSPIANDDGLTVPFGEAAHRIDISSNDILDGVGAWTIQVDNPPFGSVNNNGDGFITYNVPEGFSGVVTFFYEICNESDLCPDLCSEASITFVVQERPEVNPDSITNLVNTLTPNGDGLNDQLVFEFLENNADQFPDVELIIFSRWGETLFEARPYQNDWDGTSSSGDPLPQGTYYYILRLNVPEGNIFRGDITILR